MPKKPVMKFNMSAVKDAIKKKLKAGDLTHSEAQVLEQRAPAHHFVAASSKPATSSGAAFRDNVKRIKTLVPGMDDLFEKGIPEGNAVLIAGGAGSGKTIFCLQLLAMHAKAGKKCLYMSFEESEEKLLEHMRGFGWDPDSLVKKKLLHIERMNPFDINRNIDALLAKQKGELLIDVDPVLVPKGLKPDIIVIDSLTAIGSVFSGRQENYRIYVEQLFRFLEKSGATSFLIAETKQIPEVFSASGVEEFLADGVIVFYNIQTGDARENAIEVLKMRGEKHQKKIVAMQITDTGIVVYPDQEVFSEALQHV